MKVLYLTYGEQSGVVARLTNILGKHGYDVEAKNLAKSFYYRYSSIKLPRLSVLNVLNVYFAKREFGKRWKQGCLSTSFAFDWMSRKATRIIIKAKGYDAILQSGVMFSPLLKKLPKPYFLGILDNTYLIGLMGKRRPMGIKKSWHFVEMEKRTYQLADRIFVMSEHVKRSLVCDYGISPAKIIITRVGPNVIPERNFRPSLHKYHSKRIVLIGLNFRDKGGYELLEAFRIVRAKHPTSQLIIIGDKIPRQQEGVTFKGILTKEEIAKQLEKAHVYVMPSRKEAFGIAFIEAMAFYTPCIGTDIEAIPEIIRDGGSGFVVKPRDVTELAKRLDLLLSSPELAEEMGLSGRKRYEKLFTWEVVVSKILAELGKFSLLHKV